MLAGRLLATRFGPLLVVVDGAAEGDRPAPATGAVVASCWRAPPAGDRRLLLGAGDHDLLDFIAVAVADWNDGGNLAALERVPVSVPADGFRGRAWLAMREVPAGRVASYRDLAALAGNARAARAAGSACATNPVAPFVPCHRIVRAGGALGEYGYGPDTKRALLQHEGAWE